MTRFLQGILQILAVLLLLSSCASRQLNPSIGALTATSSTSFPKTFAQAAQARWTSGNEITTLVNGDAYYPAMLQAIENAQRSITFETFAYVDGPITRKFTEVLSKKAKEGIPVLMIVDDVGSRYAGKHNEAHLRNSGVHYHTYHPPNPLRPFQYNNRTHRKILIVDGRQAFTGGAGFALAWEGNAHSSDHWRDTQYEITGPAVAQLQHAFAENWQELTGRELTGQTYFPPLSKTGSHLAQFIHDSPRTPSNPMAHTFLHGINSARESLILEQSYFVPNKVFRKAIVAAAQRCVQVQMLVPSDKIDSPFCRYASQNSWKDLLKAGVRLYQYTPTMMHGKLMIVDGRLSIVGSGNMDGRSFFINDEVNLHACSLRASPKNSTPCFSRTLR
ncbi:MAG: cardiolipin synthase [Verrucomicrobiales bacterium]|jgi:cardiolipin synthase